MDWEKAHELGFYDGWNNASPNHTLHGIPEELRADYYDGYADGYKAAKNGEYADEE